jgi:hypothetical protein
VHNTWAQFANITNAYLPCAIAEINRQDKNGTSLRQNATKTTMVWKLSYPNPENLSLKNDLSEELRETKKKSMGLSITQIPATPQEDDSKTLSNKTTTLISLQIVNPPRETT